MSNVAVVIGGKVFSIDNIMEIVGSAGEKMIDELSSYQLMLDACTDCTKILSPDGKIEKINQAACLALGLEPSSSIGREWLSLLPENVQTVGQQSLVSARLGLNVTFSTTRPAQQGDTRNWNYTLTPIFSPAGDVKGILCVSREVTWEQKNTQARTHLFEFDQLTHIPNRAHFQRYLKYAIQNATALNQSITLFNANLDHFKLVNDTRGHCFGDHILQVVARRLVNIINQKGYVARLSSDEFAIIVPTTLSVEEIDKLTQKIINSVGEPISYLDQSVRVSISIGVATWPDQVEDDERLMQAAGIALAEVKKSGRGGVYYYSDEMLCNIKKISEQLELAQFAINAKTVEPYYQPKVNLHDGKIVGLEALLRCTTENGELAFPADIWAAFESHSLAEKLGEQIRLRVFNDIKSWLAKGLSLVPVSINASPVEFMWDNYAEKFLTQLSAHEIAPTMIEIEITEHMIVGRGADFVIRAIKKLREQGVRIALDDFGTGYSALSNIKEYAVDVIKVDRSFVNCLNKEDKGRAIIKSLYLLASCLGIEVVAEGIEDCQQRDILIHEGYNIGQGYLFSPAVDHCMTEKLLTRTRL